ncbi:MAG: dacC [Chlamydiales bacterium]|nr:dacC [Chlamydiales bacterium]
MKRRAYSLKCLSIIYLIFSHAQCFSLSFDVKAESALLVDAETGAVLYEKNSEKEMYPASVTKMATALYAFSLKGDSLPDLVRADRESVASISSERKVRHHYQCPAYWIEVGSSHVGIKEGEELSLKDLFYAMLLPSGNDASNVIAQYGGAGSIPRFMEGMNVYLKSIGCRATHFKNPHGLHHPDHRTTAEDLSIIARRLLKEPFLAEVVKTPRYQRPQTNKQPEAPLLQTNRLLLKGPFHYPEAIGIKTGYTSAAGYNLVAAAKKGDRTLIAVLLKCSQRSDTFLDAKRLFQEAFLEPLLRQQVIAKGRLFERSTKELKIQAEPKDPLYYDYYPSAKEPLTYQVSWHSKNLPIFIGEEVGTLELLTEKGRLIAKTPLLSTVEVKERSFLFIYLLAACLLGSGIALYLKKR